MVIKRNGNRVPFDYGKIESAVYKAVVDTDKESASKEFSSRIAAKVKAAIEELDRDVSVEEIQDMVEEFLMNSKRKDIARCYVRYRYKKEIAREVKSDFFDAIGEKLEARNVQNQNANVDERSFGGRIGEASGVVTKKYALDYIVSEMARNNHLNNEIYIHDLDNYAVGSHNCLSIPFDDLLKNGFNTRQTDVRPANSVNTAFQLVAVIFQLQSLQQFGGVSATHLDWTMVPYVRKSFFKHYKDGLMYVEGLSLEDVDKEMDLYGTSHVVTDLSIEDRDVYSYSKAYEYAMNMTEKETYQAVEGMYHNLK